MSTMTAARVAPRPARTSPRPARTTAQPARLRLVDAAPLQGHHTGFVLLCLALVVGGLLAALLLNTARAESSFVVSDLKVELTRLHDQRVTLEAELAAAESPDTLAKKAARMGMEPSPSTAVLRLSDGAVLGVAAGIDGNKTFTVATDGPTGETSPGEQAAAEAGSGR